MAISKCQFCGGCILRSQDGTFGVCSVCGLRYPLSNADDKARPILHNHDDYDQQAQHNYQGWNLSMEKTQNKEKGLCAVSPEMQEYEHLWEAVSAGGGHTVGLKVDGTVVAVGDNEYGQCDVKGWRDIVSVSAGGSHTVGLKADGTVVAVGDNEYGQCDVKGWRDIVSVSAGGSHTVGLKADGTVVAVGNNDFGKCDVTDWRDIVAVSAGGELTVGLKTDGTVVAVGDNDFGKCDVTDWRDIVAVSAGDMHTVGLKEDGTVVAVGNNAFGQCDVKDWRDIVAVCAGCLYTVGLKADGTAVIAGGSFGGCDASGWRNIVAISMGEVHSVGLKADGTVVAVGPRRRAEMNCVCDLTGWKDIRCKAWKTPLELRRNNAEFSHATGLKPDSRTVAAAESRKTVTQQKEIVPKQVNAEASSEPPKSAGGWQSDPLKGKSEKAQMKILTLQTQLHFLKDTIEEVTLSRDSLQAELAALRGLFTGERCKC